MLHAKFSSEPNEEVKSQEEGNLRGHVRCSLKKFYGFQVLPPMQIQVVIQSLVGHARNKRHLCRS